MKLPGYHSSGQFARMAGVSLRTIRFYDKQNILKPSYVNPAGARFYTDADFARLQQILLLKYLGFSLDDIREMTISGADDALMLNSLKLQKRLVEDRIEQMQLVAEAIEETAAELERQSGKTEKTEPPDWSRMLRLIHLTGMEKSMKTQYQNATNISARIRLHRTYSVNPEGWFPWLYRQSGLLEPEKLLEKEARVSGSDAKKLRVLELGCGDGALWTENIARLLKLCQSGCEVQLVLSDISEGMLRDARRSIETALTGERERIEEKRETTKEREAKESDERKTVSAAKTKAGTEAKPEAKTQSVPAISYRAFDCADIPFPDETFDLIFANHVLFYCTDVKAVLREAHRVLKPGGRLVCSTYGKAHMHEISELVQAFDPRIALAAENLYERFGLENGAEILASSFSHVEKIQYADAIELNEAQPLIEYILSCHGNQNQLLLDRYKEFRSFTERKVRSGFHITKEAGIFLATRKKIEKST